MSRRLIQRNANMCFALALGCAPFTLLFLLLQWHEQRFSVATLLSLTLPLGLIYLGKHFQKTETPREVWWFGSSTDFAVACLNIESAKAFLSEFALLVESGFGEDEVQSCLEAMQQVLAEGEAICVYSITYRAQKATLSFDFEWWEELDDKFLMTLCSHADVVAVAQKILQKYDIDEI